MRRLQVTPAGQVISELFPVFFLMARSSTGAVMARDYGNIVSVVLEM
jgi:hypothetical protein